MTKFQQFVSQYRREEDGAVTIDWVALTAGILLLGIAVVYGIFSSGVADLTTEINSSLGTAVQVNTGNAPSQGTFE